MKKYTLFLLTAISLLIVSCSANMMGNKDKLYTNSWELEYITGPKIAFEGLFPEQKPMLTFEQENSRVVGTTGCNGYNTQYKLDGSSISFEEPNAMTMRYCEGNGQQVFMKAMQDVNKYRITADGKLELIMNDVVMMRFKKATK